MTPREEIQLVLDGPENCGRSWSVLTGDWSKALAGTGDEDGSIFDHVITDAPYDRQTHAGARTLADGGEETPIDFEPLTNTEFVFMGLHLARRWVISFCALEQLGLYRETAGDDWVRAGIWHRTDGTPQLTGDRPAQAAEGIAIMHRPGKKRWNGGGSRGLWSYGVERTDRVHPTQKPLDLMLRLVELFTDPGDVVLDPFCGSGTTGVACLRLGRRFVGIELDPKYADVARERMQAEERGLSLRDARAGQTSLFGNNP